MNFEDLTANGKGYRLQDAGRADRACQKKGIKLTDEQLESVSGGGWSSPSCGDDAAWTYVC